MNESIEIEIEIEIIIVLDRSGSMTSIKRDMEGGLNQFIEDQKKEPGECKVTLTQFDSEYEIVFSGKPIQDVPPISLVPRGSTALHDALGRTIHDVVARHKAAEAPKCTLCLIITDGQENASREFSRDSVRKLVEERRAAGWEFVYLGANQDAFVAGHGLGIAKTSDFQASKGGVEDMSTSMGRRTRSYRSGSGYN